MIHYGYHTQNRLSDSLWAKIDKGIWTPKLWFRCLTSLPKPWETSSAEQLRSSYVGEFGTGLLTNTAFNILVTISRAVNRPRSSFSSAEVQPPGKAMLEGAQRISAPTDAVKSPPWLLNFFSPNAVQLDQQPHSCLASAATPCSSSGWKSWITAHSSRQLCMEELPGGCAASHGSYSQKPCEASNKSEDCQILASDCELSPISRQQTPFPLPSVHMAELKGLDCRWGKKVLPLLSPPISPTLSQNACTQRKYKDSHSFPLHPRWPQWECSCAGHWIEDCTQLCVRPALATKPQQQGLAPNLKKQRMKPQYHSHQTELRGGKDLHVFKVWATSAESNALTSSQPQNQGGRFTAKIRLQQSELLLPSVWCWFCNRSGSFIFNCYTNAL